MPSPSRGDAPAGAIADLGLPVRATTVLARAGITRIDDLAVLTRRELAAVAGLGPALIAAIRQVVPEPAGAAPAVGASAAGEKSPVPSFASLRAPQRRTALDLLMPGAPAAEPVEVRAAEPVAPPTRAAEPAAPPPRAAEPVAPPPRVARPAEYADLLRIGAHLVRAVAGMPARCLRWLLG